MVGRRWNVEFWEVVLLEALQLYVRIVTGVRDTYPVSKRVFLAAGDSLKLHFEGFYWGFRCWMDGREASCAHNIAGAYVRLDPRSLSV